MIIIILIMTEHVWIGCKKRWRLSADYFAPRGVPQSLWPQTTNDALDVVCTQCYAAGSSDLKNSCTECWAQKTKPGYLDLNQQLPMHKGTSLAMVWPQQFWCTGSCVQKTKRGYLIKWTVSYCTVWHTPRKHIRWPHFNVPTWVVRHCFKAVGGPPTLADTWHNYLSTLLIKHTDLTTVTA